jgi:hypothetical protein
MPSQTPELPRITGSPDQGWQHQVHSHCLLTSRARLLHVPPTHPRQRLSPPGGRTAWSMCTGLHFCRSLCSSANDAYSDQALVWSDEHPSCGTPTCSTFGHTSFASRRRHHLSVRTACILGHAHIKDGHQRQRYFVQSCIVRHCRGGLLLHQSRKCCNRDACNHVRCLWTELGRCMPQLHLRVAHARERAMQAPGHSGLPLPKTSNR